MENEKDEKNTALLNPNKLVTPTPRHKSRSRRWRAAPAILLGFECLESTAFCGMATNLVEYLTTVLHGSNSWSAASVTTWTGTCYFTPLIGALVADTFWGNYKTVFLSSFLYLLGLAVITSAAAWVPADGDTALKMAFFFAGLYLVAFGSGGVKSGLLPLGAEQFDGAGEEEAEEEEEEKSSFFNWFYVCLSSGSITSIILIWVQENISWAIGFGIATACLALGLGALAVGEPSFRRRSRPSGSPLKSILQVLVSSVINRGSPAGAGAGELIQYHELEDDDEKEPCFPKRHERIERTHELKFLDRAAIVRPGIPNWRLCTVTQVEEVKILARLLPIWATGILFSAAYAQIGTTFIQQGRVMDREFAGGALTIPPATLASLQVVFVLAWVVINGAVVLPAASRITKNPAGLTELQRMGVGRFLICAAMIAAAAVESARLRRSSGGAPAMGISWQVPQYFLLAGSEVFNYISQLEFSYGEAPETMKSVCTAMSLLTISLGSYLSSAVVTAVEFLTARSGGGGGWISEDLDEGHLDYYFAVLAGLCGVNFVFHVLFARSYVCRRKKTTMSAAS